jgi:signal transduction histidine kinase
MVNINSRAKYRRMILIYSLVIIIPGTLLSILAYRGIQGNYMAARKISNDRLERKSKYFFGDIKNSIDSCLEAFSDNKDIQGDIHFSMPNGSRALDYVKQGIILGAAYREEEGPILLLNRTSLFIPDDYRDKYGINHPEVNKLIRLLELEILGMNNQETLKAYARLEMESADTLFRLHSIAGQARINRKLNDYPQAIAFHRKFLELASESNRDGLLFEGVIEKIHEIINLFPDDPDIQISSKLPVLITLELISFASTSYNYLTERHFIELYHDLKNEYSNISSEYLVNPGFDGFMKGLISGRDYDILKSRITGKLFGHIYNNLTIKNNRVTNSVLPHVPWFEDSVSVILASNIQPGYNVAMILNVKKLLYNNIPVLNEKTGFPNKIAWRLIDEEGGVVKADTNFDPGDFYLEINPDHLGSWQLQLQEKFRSRFDMLWEPEEYIFVFVFIFLIVLMAVGLIVTIRSLTIDYKLSQLKSDFVSTVSHEFKSPLTSIRMMSERLANKKVSSEDRRQEYYSSMLTQSERLSHLVDNILDFSRMDKGRKRYNFEVCNLMKIAREVVNYLKMRHREKDFDIELVGSEDPMIAMVDCQGIHQVLYNLIENAIIYSGESRRIDILFERHGQEISFTVRDYGIGISKKDQKRIFGQFYRGERSRNDGIKGSGIGLSIVDEIIKAHRGKIELESEPGKGSSFTCYLPVNQK